MIREVTAILLTVIFSFASFGMTTSTTQTPWEEPQPIAADPEATVGESVEGWADAFTARWNDEHGDAFAFHLEEPSAGEAYQTLLIGNVDMPLDMEVYFSQGAQEYWVSITLYHDYIEDGELDLYESYFTDMIFTTLETWLGDTVSPEALAQAETDVLDIIARLVAEESEELFDTHLFIDETDTYLSIDYDPDWPYIDCYISFVTYYQ